MHSLVPYRMLPQTEEFKFQRHIHPSMFLALWVHSLCGHNLISVHYILLRKLSSFLNSSEFKLLFLQIVYFSFLNYWQKINSNL